MGAGGSKSHQAFTIAPALDVDEQLAAVDPPPVDVGGLLVEWDDEDVLTPIPETVGVDELSGASLLLGGADFEDANVTIMAYERGDETQAVLYGWVHPSAEEKLLAAAISEDDLIPVTSTVEVTGRLPFDRDQKIFEELQIAVKSVNHHISQADKIPEHTKTRLGDVQALLEGAPEEQRETLQAHYGPFVDGAMAQIAAKEAGEAGTKLPWLDALEVLHEEEVTSFELPSVLDIDAGSLPAHKQQITRPSTSIVEGRHRIGSTRQTLSGADVEYRFDLGDGYVAYYRPHDPSVVKGLQGQLEVVAAPSTKADPQQLVARLRQLNLNNGPLTRQECEYAYLSRNAWAQGVDTAPGVIEAIDVGHHIIDAHQELLMADRAPEAVDLEGDELKGWLRDIRLDAERQALPKRTELLREAVATSLGYSSGAEMTSLPGYDPTPTLQGTKHSWNRFDVHKNDSVAAAFSGKRLVHSVTGGNLGDVLRSGGFLAAQEHRKHMGVSEMVGMSEAADVGTGGSRVVDLRVQSTKASSYSGAWLEWADPQRLLARSDWYAYNGDKFANFHSGGQTRDPVKLAKHTNAANEVLFRDGIDLFGPHGPDRIHAGSVKKRKELIAALVDQGRSTIRGRPIGEVIVA